MEAAASLTTDSHASLFSRPGILVLVVAAVFLFLMESIGRATLANPRTSTDFRQFYSAGILVRTDPQHLYSLTRQKQIQDQYVAPRDLVMPSVHPSYEGAFFSLFTFLPYPTAYLTFIAFNVCLLLVIAHLALQSGVWPGSSLPLVACIFLFIPVIVAVWHGQDSILFLTLCCLSWSQLKKGRDQTAGVILALALFRYHLAIPIAIFIAIRRGWRFLLAFAATGLVIAGVCIAITGVPATREMIQTLSAFTLSANQSQAVRDTLGIQPLAMPNLRGLIYGIGAGRLPAHITVALIAIASLGLLLWCLWRSRRLSGLDAVVALAATCTVLIAGHLYMHDASLLLLPMFLLRARMTPLLTAALYGLPAILFVGGYWAYFFLIALPALWLLWIAAKIEQEPQPMPPHAATPLYTQS